MKNLLDQSQLIETLSRLFSRTSRFQIASAQVTRSGLSELLKSISACLVRGGSGGILFGVDLPTEPDAVEQLIELRDKYPNSLEIKWFNPGARGIFHPKLWAFKLKSGKHLAVIGSSNFTRGGLRVNFEINILIDSSQAASQMADRFDEYFWGAESPKSFARQTG